MSSSDLAASIESLSFQISGLSYQLSQSLRNGQSADTREDIWSAAGDSTKSTRSRLLNTILELQDAVMGPSDNLRAMATAWASPSALRWIVHFKIADHVPETGAISYGDLASAAKVPENQLKPITRFAMTNGLFSELQPGYVAHTSISRQLRTQHPLHDYVSNCLELSMPIVTKMAEATDKFGETDAKDQTAFNVAYDTPLPMFAWLKQHPDHATRFGRLMHAMHTSPVYDVKHLVIGYKWEELGEAKVVDVGGGLGHCSVALAKAFPKLHCVVQDQDYVVKDAKIPEEFSGRVEVVAHDFFQEEDIRDGDVYLLRQIIHDWPDDSAVKILKNVVSALKKGSKIVIMDQVVPAPGQRPRLEELTARTVDLVVMSHFNARERAMEDWEKLLSKVDPRLRIKSVIQPEGSIMSVLEVVLDEERVNGHEQPEDESAETKTQGHKVHSDDKNLIAGPTQQVTTNGVHA
jgi:6-hydroxytryprostatin B O-methyltransferase